MNDPRITAYALGELEGRDREEFERDLAASGDLQRELDKAIRLAAELGRQPMSIDLLKPAQRTTLLEQCVANQHAAHRRRKIIRLAVPLAIAAGVCLLAVPVMLRQTEAPVLAASGRLEETPTVTAPLPPPVLVADAKLEQTIPKVRAPNSQLAEQASRQVLRHELAAAASKTGAETDTLFALAGPAAAGVTADSLSRSAASERISTFTAGWGKGAGTGVRTREFADESGSFLAPSAEFNTEGYNAIRENVFLAATDNPLSTFSIDVDTASYSNVRRFLRSDQMPPAGAIRTEEFINYFPYDYPQPRGDVPFSVNLEVARAPWDSARELVRIGIKGRELGAEKRPASNLVFLIDVSGSMNSPDKLPLLQRSLRALVENLRPQDQVAIVVYAGSSGLVLPSTPGTRKQEIIAALESLTPGGTTHGSEGIKLAYETARGNFIKEGNNRVILCTDGDFNVGVTNQSELERLIEKERTSGVFLSVLGFGTGNLQDSTMELLADKGNGNYAYIDSLAEGRKVLVEQMGATLFTIAKDVKIQVEFNPARVGAYRLIGYENRLLAKEDFNDDKKDAGEIGAGHTVTALYEVIPAGGPVPGAPSVDPLKYEQPAPMPRRRIYDPSGELLTVKLRYKAPDGDKSRLLEMPLAAETIPAFAGASADFRFAATVAAFGMKLRNSPERGEISWDEIQQIARGALGADAGSYRAEFITLVEAAKRLAPADPQQD